MITPQVQARDVAVKAPSVFVPISPSPKPWEKNRAISSSQNSQAALNKSPSISQKKSSSPPVTRDSVTSGKAPSTYLGTGGGGPVPDTRLSVAPIEESKDENFNYFNGQLSANARSSIFSNGEGFYYPYTIPL
jgi:hypothetical protein